MRLQHRIAVVTGGGQGIGRAIATAFAAEGATGIIAEIDLEAGSEGEAAIGPAARFIPTDVAGEASVRSLMERAAAEFGGPHILVNNAGIGGTGSLLDADAVARWDRVLSPAP